MRLQMITANRLKDGAVVYLDESEGWTRNVEQGDSVPAQSADLRMSVAQKSVAEQIVVAPYVIDVEVGGSRVTPVRYREQIRAFGPTVS